MSDWASDEPNVLDSYMGSHIETPPDTKVKRAFGIQGRGQPFAPNNTSEIRGFRQSGITGSSAKTVCELDCGIIYCLQVSNI